MPKKPMPTHARAVIIGAGIAGCSVAYHLAHLGWKDIVVIDQGPLFETGGSTSHAPGLVYQINPSKTMASFAKYTVDLWSELTLDGESLVNQVGSLEVAWTPERLQELKRRAGFGLSWGIEAHVISTPEAREMVPTLSDRILGALYVPSDIQTKAIRPAEAMARGAQGNGAQFFGNVKVTGFDIAGGRIREVQTDCGGIKTDLVVSAVGIWAPKLGALAGIPIPLSPMQHIYAVTTPVEDLTNTTDEISQPFVRHQDRSMYLRQHRDSYGIGSYFHEPLLVDSNDLNDYSDASNPPAEMPFTADHFQAALNAAGEVIPTLKDAELTRKFNGLFSFTTDSFPILGEAPQVKGFWSAQAVWITQAGGVGRAVAEWIANGDPGVDLRECDIARFHPHDYNRTYINARASQQYREVYDIIHPLQQISNPRNLRITPFHQRHAELGAVFFENSGWERPQWYESNRDLVDELQPAGASRQGWESREWSPIVAAEHVATRQRVAMFDLTPFAKFEVNGQGALAALQHLTTNQMDRPVGAVTYTSMLTPDGGISCDLTVTRLFEDRFLIVTGGGTRPRDLKWIQSHLPEDGSATVTDISSGLCAIGLWGPEARNLLSRVCDDDIEDRDFRYLTSKSINILDVPALALRISYVGELGWEIYAPVEYGQHLWDILWEAGQSFGVIAAGSAAFDSLRLEKGYRLWGNDIHTDYNPYEAGIGFAVKMGKGDFIGKDALQDIRKKGIAQKLCCLTLDDPTRVVMGKEPIMHGKRVLGYVTSANYGHSIGKAIAYGYLPIEHAETGTSVDIVYFGERIAATLQNEPLYDARGTKLKS